MGLFSDNKSSITFYIDNLSNYPEIEWYQFQQLTDSIVLVPSGSKEAIEAIRKKLKHGSVQQQLRALDILKLLSENSNHRFHRDLILNEKMKERLEFILDSPSEDMRVKKIIMSLLQNWILRFKNERGIQSIEQLYEKGKLWLRCYSSSTKKNNNRNRLKDEIVLANNLANELLIEVGNTRQYSNNKHLNCLEENKKVLCYLNQQQGNNKKEEFHWTNKLIASNEELFKVISLYELLTVDKDPFLKEDSNHDEEDPFADPPSSLLYDE